MDIVVKDDDRSVDVYEVKRYPNDPYAQLARYARAVTSAGLSFVLGSQLLNWAVAFKIGSRAYIAWQFEDGVVWFAKKPDDGDEIQDAELRAANQIASSNWAGESNRPGSVFIPPVGISSPVPAPVI